MVAISRPWYNSSYTMAAKPIKTLESHYTIIQFLIMVDRLTNERHFHTKGYNNNLVVCGLRPRCIISKMAVLACCSSVRRGNFKFIFSPDTTLLGPEKLAIGR